MYSLRLRSGGAWSTTGYNRELRKVTKTKGVLSTSEAMRKGFWLVYQKIAINRDRLLPNWELTFNGLAIGFEGRIPK